MPTYRNDRIMAHLGLKEPDMAQNNPHRTGYLVAYKPNRQLGPKGYLAVYIGIPIKLTTNIVHPAGPPGLYNDTDLGHTTYTNT